MTTKLAIIIIVLIAGFFVLDAYVLQLNSFIFLSRKVVQLIHYLAFWR